MILTKAELQLLLQLAKGNKKVKGLALALSRNKTQIYRTVAHLTNKGFLAGIEEGIIIMPLSVHVSLLLQLLAQHSALVLPLSGSGISILTACLQSADLDRICQTTHLKTSIVYRKLRQGRHIQLIQCKNNHYSLNDTIWPQAVQFIQELKTYELSLDLRVPLNATIYYKNDKEIVFSLLQDFDATPTAFSAYERFGIKILTHTHFYHLPKKSLSKKEIFLHSLDVAAKEKSTRYYLYVALFYLKYRKELKLKNSIVDSLLQILDRKIIPGYPSLEEIKEKAEIYNIKW